MFLNQPDYVIINNLNIQNANARNYSIKNAYINMVQYKLDSKQLNQLTNAIDSGLYIRTFNETEVLNILYMKPYPVIQFTKNLKRNGVQRCLIAFTSDMYKKSPFARKNDRFNKGIQNVTFKLNVLFFNL